jgi:exosortase D (VPLPA-CTERM-specific)
MGNVKVKFQFDSTPPAIGRILVYTGLLAVIFYSTFSWLVIKDWSREDYSSGYLIPAVVLYLIWEKRGSLARAASLPQWAGLAMLVPGLLLFWLGELSGEFFSLYLSSWFVVVGLCWMHLGWQKLKIIAFPLAFLLTMFPLPNFLHGKVSFQLKLISSQMGVAMIQAYGMTAFREGNVIDLGFTQLQVVDACSGLRYLIPLIVLGLLMAYFFRAALWKRIFLVVSTIPISVFVNSLRIASVGILYKFFGPAVAEGFFHDFSGWFIFMITIGLLLGQMWALKWLPSKGREQGIGNREQGIVEKGLGVRGLLKPPQFVVAVVLLGLTAAVSQGVEFREKIPISKPLDQFPLVIGDWKGTCQSMEQKFIDTLDLSDYTIVDYQNGTGKAVNFYVAYYESQRKGESIHSPETCLPGGGWVFRDAGTVKIAIAKADQPTITVNRAVMDNKLQRQLTYFWFPARGRVLTDAYQMKFYTFWDALTRQRTDGGLVRLITPIYEGEDVARADERLQAFARDAVPVLEEFLPN